MQTNQAPLPRLWEDDQSSLSRRAVLRRSSAWSGGDSSSDADSGLQPAAADLPFGTTRACLGDSFRAATDPCLLPDTSASETRARCRQRGVCRAAQPPRRIFWPEEVWRPSFVTRGAKLRVWRQRLTPLTRPRRSDCEGSHDLKPTAFGRSCSRKRTTPGPKSHRVTQHGVPDHGQLIPGPAKSFISGDPHGSVGPLSPRSTPGFDFRRVIPPRDKKIL